MNTSFLSHLMVSAAIISAGLVNSALAQTVPLENKTFSPAHTVAGLVIEPENVVAVEILPTLLQEYDKSFTFNWQDAASIAENKTKVEKIETYLKSIASQNEMLAKDREAQGSLLYKLGTYYSHVARNPDLAIAKMNAANNYLISKEAKAWSSNQLAYAYEEKYAALGKKSDKEKAFAYTAVVLNHIYPHEKNAIVAFAHRINGLLFADAKNYAQAEGQFNQALAIYSAISGNKNDQYARTQNRLAATMLELHGRDQEAVKILEQLKQYWVAKKNVAEDPFAARNFILLGQAYLKTNQPQAARDEFLQAINIYEHIYGKQHAFLSAPYQLLSKSYQQLGDEQQAALYRQKASVLAKG
jgi:tetratricopeptide (TPR) repeat protein